jgi:hypothetical protein
LLFGGNRELIQCLLKIVQEGFPLRVGNFGSMAVFVGKRAVEKPAPWKSPKAGLSHYARKSRRDGGIPNFSTAPTAAISFFLISPQKQE